MKGCLVVAHGEDADIVVTQCYVSDQRVDVGEEVTVGFRLEWADTGKPLSHGTVYIEGEGQSYLVWEDGWVIFMDTCDYPYIKEWMIDYVRYNGAPYTVQLEEDPPTCVFDRVHITLIPEHERTTIGEEPSMIVYAFYESNYESFNGTVHLNYTEGFDFIGRRGVKVSSIDDHWYGIREFDGNVVKMIWDRVNVDLFAPRKRYNPGREAKLEYLAYYESDLEPFLGEVTFNDTLVKDEVGRYRYTVKTIDDWRNGVTEFTADTADLIFDKVVVDIEVEDTRIGVGEKAEIKYSARYFYDDSEFSGDISFTATRKDVVGKQEVTVWRMMDKQWFLNTFEANSVEVIWDRVRVDIDAPDTRVNVGEEVTVGYTACYEYDSTPLEEGEVTLNADSIRREDVGNFTFTVAEAYGGLYDIGVVDADELTVVWDRVEFTPKESITRILEVRPVEPVMRGVYAYDGTPFQGSYEVGYKEHSGFKTYRVEAIEDDLYGLSCFTSEEGSILIDTVTMRESVTQVKPGTLEVTYTLTYDSDNAPVTDAMVQVNGETCAYQGGGVYTTTLNSFLPMATTNTLVVVGDQPVTESTNSNLLVVNAAIVVALTAVVGLVAFKALSRKKDDKVGYSRIQPP
jgi:hypothetical protein